MSGAALFDWHYVLDLLPILLRALGLSLQMALLGFGLALLLGLGLALVRIGRLRWLAGLATGYISFFRATPLLVQLFLLYYGLPQVFPLLVGIEAVDAVVIGLTLHFAAYIAESMRAAILGIDPSQWEAALSLGMRRGQALRRIILPQAARIATPSLMNHFIDLLKSTSLAFTLGVAEMMAKAQMEAAASFNYLESFTAVALIYWLVVALFSHLQQRLERHLSRGYSGVAV
ncbi:MAG: amino acid ABC transporter permease [Aeromonas sp.]